MKAEPSIASPTENHDPARPPLTPRFFLIASAIPLSWSLSFVTGRYAMRITPDSPATVTLLRFAFALLVLAPGLARWPRLGRLTIRQWAHLCMLAFTCVVLYHYLFFRGLALAPAGMASIVLAVLPILINLAAGVFLKEDVTWHTYAGAGLSAAALTVITLEKGGWTRIGWGRGETYIFFGALTWLVYTLAGRSFFRAHHVARASVVMFTIGIAMTVPIAVTEPAIRQLHRLPATWWMCVAYMGVIATGIGYLAFNASVRHLGAGRTAVFLLAIPPVTNVWGLLFFDEPLSLIKSVAIAVVLAGVWLALSSGTRARPADALPPRTAR